ncbi:MAG: hypothetical protein ACRENU_10260 [Gemmatimonadaceae bacterium]
MPRLRIQRMRMTGGGKPAPGSKLVQFGNYLIQPQPFEREGGWATHVQVFRDFGGHVSSAQLASPEIAYSREEADKRCVEYAIRAIEKGLELR